MRQILRALVIVAFASLAACGGGSNGDRTKGCDAAESWIAALVAVQDVGQYDLAASTAALDRIDQALAKIGASGPGDVQAAVAALDRIPEDTLKVEEQQEREQAQTTVETWVAKDCGIAPPVTS